jgi:hypothetical protein
MSENSLNSHFKAAMLVALEETFENVHGIYLDGATSLFETLATISAEEASVPVSICTKPVRVEEPVTEVVQKRCDSVRQALVNAVHVATKTIATEKRWLRSAMAR